MWMKRTNNKGVTLIELIVVISIMSVLTGLLVPQFMRYVTQKKQQACRTNREAVLNIFEKCVYGGLANEVVSNTAEDFNFYDYVQASTVIPMEYKAEITSHWNCPDGGDFNIKVVDGVAYCECDDHTEDEDTCIVDIIGWEEVLDEVADKEMPFTTVTPTPESDNPEPSVSPSPDPGDVPSTSGYWPYMDHEIWKTVGFYSGAAIYIDVPSGKFAGRTSEGGAKTYYVAVNRNNGEATRIDRAHCEDPDNYIIGSGGTEFLVVCSGIELTASQYIEAINEDPTIVGNIGNYKTEEYKAYEGYKSQVDNTYTYGGYYDQNKQKYVTYKEIYNSLDDYIKGEKVNIYSFEEYLENEKHTTYETYCGKYGIDSTKDIDAYYDYAQILSNAQFTASFGDIYILDNGTRYIMGSASASQEKLPPQDCTADSFGNWYKMAPESEDEL